MWLQQEQSYIVKVRWDALQGENDEHVRLVPQRCVRLRASDARAITGWTATGHRPFP